jgi:hypothetical protein
MDGVVRSLEAGREGSDVKIRHNHGVYLWWPERGEAMFHPDDVDLARKLIPSRRVFRRETFLDGYVVLAYGTHRLRLQPTLFLPAQSDGFEIGDPVQVLSRCGKNWPLIGRVAQMLWHVRGKRNEYLVRHVDRVLPRLYSAADLEPIEWIERFPGPQPVRRAP